MEEKLAVLAIDDEQVVLDSIARHLRKENFTLHSVLNAREGLELMERESIDIVLTDLMMPGIDGLEMLKLIKQKNPRTPVIMITGYATINSALEATRLGAFDYIAKPFTKQELLSVMERAAELVEATRNQAVDSADQPADHGLTGDEDKAVSPGEHGWKKLRDDGTVLLGVDQSFLERVGNVQNVFLPAVGDQLRQGGAYLRVFSSDMRAHTVLSPLSGTVVEINDKIADQPLSICEHPSESCWLIRLKPSKFDLEIKELGLQDES